MVKSIAEIRNPEIVQATIAAIAKHGLPNPSYDTIAEAADMSRQLIRHYFPTPEDLMVTVCDGLAAAHREALVQGILTTNVRNRLPVFLDFYFDILSGPKERKPRDERVYTALYAMATTSKKVRQRLTSHAGELETAIVHEIQIAYPKMPNTACAELGYLFMTLMYGHWRMVGTFGYSEERNVVARDAMDRLIASYTQRYDDPNDPEPPLSEI